MNDGKHNDAEPVDKLIETGSNMAGSVAGAAIGFFTGGPAGAIAGAAAGPVVSEVFRRVGAEVRSRLLSKCEEIRAGAAVAYAADTIRRRLGAGESFRADGFFDEEPGNRPAAEEVAEKTLLEAQRDPEEKKTRYYGIMLGNFAFIEGVGRSEANQLLTLCERLSYRQLCVLRILQDTQSYGLRDQNYRDEGLRHERLSLLHEVFDLYSQGLVHASGKAFLGIGDIHPAILGIQGTALLVVTLAELQQIEQEDLEEVAALLR